MTAAAPDWSATPMADERRGGDRDWLFHALSDLKDQMVGQHQRIRSDMNAGFDRVTAEVHSTVRQLDEVDTRVTKIEVAREIEASQAVRRSTWAGMMAAAGITGLLQLARAAWHSMK